MTPEQKLWQAVILKAFTDATAVNPSSREDRMEKSRADSWIRGCGRDFRFVCSLAGMDPEFLSLAYRQGRVRPELLRADRSREPAA